MQEIDLHERAKAYLQAFEERDLHRCIDFFDHDACIHFIADVYQGKQAIEEWHKERFVADLRVVRLQGITVKGKKVRIKGRVKSKRIRAWPAKNLSGIMTLFFEQGKIKEAKFGLGAIWTS